MDDDDFTPLDFDRLASDISVFASPDSSEVVLQGSWQRLTVAAGDEVGAYRIVQVKGNRFDVVCLTCGTPNNVSRGKIKIRGCPNCRDERAAEKWHVPLTVGEVYGFLKVVEDSAFKITNTGRRAHRVQCVCLNCAGGGIKEYEAQHVRGGRTVSCGCVRRSTSARRGFHAEIGGKYGRWTVLRRHHSAIVSGKKDRKRYWCRCECGTEAAVLSFQLKNANTQSGCRSCANKALSESQRGKKRSNGGIGTRVPVEIQQANRRKWKRDREAELRSDPRYRAISAMRKRCSKLVKGGAGNKLVFGTTRERFLRYIESQFLSGMTWENYGTTWQIDHIFPLSRIDPTNPIHLKAATNWRNLRPLLSKDNYDKLDSVTRKAQLLFEFIVDVVVFEESHGSPYSKSLQCWLADREGRLVE